MHVSTGADIVGINCRFDPSESLKSIKRMKEGLDKAGLKAHLMYQPIGYHCSDAQQYGHHGFAELPEFPYGR